MTSNDSKVDKIQKHFQVLSSVASSLNTASDALTKAVDVLDASLKKLNVGLTSWVTFRDRAEHLENYYDLEQIGYTKVDGTWGIALRHVWGDYNYEDGGHEEGPWLFNDASRELRLRSVDKIPDLIEKLGKEATDFTSKIQAKALEVNELAGVVEKIASERASTKKGVPKLSDLAKLGDKA